MECPKCSHPNNEGEISCAACGFVFAKWDAYQRQRSVSGSATVVNAENATAENKTNECNAWTRRWGGRALLLLCVGFLLPLYKHSMLAGQSILIWPWRLAGRSEDPAVLAALATVSEGRYPGSWVLLPLVVAVLAFVIGRMGVGKKAALAYIFLGGGALILLLVIFIEENERFGLVFTPPTIGAGIIQLLTIMTGAIIAASNRAASIRTDLQLSRVTGIAGILLGISVLFFVFASQGPWAVWPMQCVYGITFAYAALGVMRLFGDSADTASIFRLSLVGRILIIWSLIAVILAQNGDQNEFSRYVIQSGGNLISTTLATFKCFLIFFGCAVIFSIGVFNFICSEQSGMPANID